MADDQAIRFEGKVDGWYYALILFVNVLFIGCGVLAISDPSSINPPSLGVGGALAISLSITLLCDVLLVPSCFARWNYAEFDGAGNLRARFGVIRLKTPLNEIRSVSESDGSGFIAAASSNYFQIASRTVDMVIAVKDRDAFFAELERRCPHACIKCR